MSILSESELKNILQIIKEEDMTYYKSHKEAVLKGMIHHIGSTDAELRDQLIYTMFCRLIIEQKEIETGTLNELLDTCLNSLLFYRIDEKESDAVFTRSFATLLMALILHRDIEENFLTEEQFKRTKTALIQYLTLEKDTRGYVNGNGWAHSIAHAADAVDELIANPKLNPKSFPELFNIIIVQIMRSDILAHDEEERLINPLLRLLDRGMDIGAVHRKLESLPRNVANLKPHIDDEQYWYVIHNVKTFLKSLYIRLNEDNLHVSLQQIILHILKKL